MIIYVNGDSHSFGTDAGGPNWSYGKWVSANYQASFFCDAEPGCSNDRIIRTTQEYLKTNTPDLIIIGWSTWEREEWQYHGKTFTVTGSGFDTVPDEMIQDYKKWVIEMCTTEGQISKELEAHESIWKLHTQLLDSGIRHLFFNCYSYYHYTVFHNLKKYDWGANYIKPYDKNYTFFQFLLNQGFAPKNPEYYHHGAPAQKRWAEFLIPYIDNL